MTELGIHTFYEKPVMLQIGFAATWRIILNAVCLLPVLSFMERLDLLGLMQQMAANAPLVMLRWVDVAFNMCTCVAL